MICCGQNLVCFFLLEDVCVHLSELPIYLLCRPWTEGLTVECIDLLIIGVGKHNLPLSPETRQHISELGMRVEMLDTRNAAAQFNLLATERGVSEVAAALIPIGWEEGVGVAP